MKTDGVFGFWLNLRDCTLMPEMQLAYYDWMAQAVTVRIDISQFPKPVEFLWIDVDGSLHFKMGNDHYQTSSPRNASNVQGSLSLIAQGFYSAPRLSQGNAAFPSVLLSQYGLSVSGPAESGYQRALQQTMASLGPAGRFTVPVLWDKQQHFL